jgi:uncharacterized protein YjbI with pentapeptide repeats
MKLVKPQRLGFLSRVVEQRGEIQLAVAVLAYFPFSAPDALLPEMEMWKTTAAALGKEGILDEGAAKPRGELLVTGACYAPRGAPVAACKVRVSAGPLDKTLYVAGDREWRRGAATDPEPFAEMKLTWDRAFGGVGFAQNPVGRGFAPVKGDAGESHPLPNVEDPAHLVASPNDRPAPAGFGPYDLTWPQRFAKIGTYDDRWLKQDFPGLARDLDPSFFNVAPRDQQLEGFWKGGEAITIENMHPAHAVLTTSVPRVVCRCFVNLRDGAASGPKPRAPAERSPTEGATLVEVPLRIDTIRLFPAEERGVAVFRGTVRVAEDDAHDVLQAILAYEDPAAPKTVDHYREVLRRRLDDKKKRGGLRDFELSPAGAVDAPEDDALDVVGEKEGLLTENLRRKAEKELEKTREQLRAAGVDPQGKVPDALPPPRKKVSPEETAQLVEDLAVMKEKAREGAAAAKADAEKEMRALCAANGLDYEKVVNEQRKRRGSPRPKLSAAEEMARLRALLAKADAVGAPVPELRARLADPGFEGRLVKLEETLRESYRKHAHHHPEAFRLDGAEGARARAEVVAARESGASLAGRELTGVDLSGLDLRGLDLRGAYLEHATLADSDLRGVVLEDAVLTRADLSGVDLQGAKLAGANLGGACLAKANLASADLSRAVLFHADLERAVLTGASLASADLSEAVFTGAVLEGAKAPGATFNKADLSGVRFASADLVKARFLESTAVSADFSGADLTSATFLDAVADGANLDGACLDKLRLVKACSFTGATFRKASMKRANLRGARLARADFSDAVLTGADLSESDLTEAKLPRISAREARFIRADLSRAVLDGADLMFALLQKARLAGASFRGANLFRADLLRVEVDGATDTKQANLTQIRYTDARRPSEQS